MGWIDTHAHLADESLASQLPAVLERASQAGVSTCICVAVDASTSQQAIDIAASHPNVWASVGIHPNYAHQAAEDDWSRIIALADNQRVCALGETGLDLYWKDCPLPVQMENFSRHWELSRATELPVIIHMRDCEQELLAALQEQAQIGSLRGVMHCFSGSQTLAQATLEMGLYVSFAGMLTYKKSEALRAIAKQIPLDRLLVETDCPYLSPEPLRSKRPNEPSHMVHTGRCLADTLGLTPNELRDITRENTLRLFHRLAKS